MRKQLVVLLFLVSAAFSQTSNVTATITDPDGQTWNNGNVQITLIPAPGQVGPPVWAGGTNFPQKFSATMDGTGTFTVSIPDNGFITPPGSKWQFTLCSNTSAPCQNVTTSVTGGAPNLSSVLSTALAAPRFGAGQYAYGYSDTEVIFPTIGSTYYNVTLGVLRVWNGSTWGVSAGPAFSSAVTGVSMVTAGTNVVLVGPVTMANPLSNATYRFMVQVIQTTAGSGGTCTAGNVTVVLGFKDADTGVVYALGIIDNVAMTPFSSATSTNTLLMTSTANGTINNWTSTPREFRAASGTAIQYQIVQTVNSNCTVAPIFAVRPALYFLGY